MDDSAVPGRDWVDDLADRGCLFVACYHDGAGPDLSGIAGLGWTSLHTTHSPAAVTAGTLLG